MDLILDTHALAWIASDDRRLSRSLVTAMRDPDTRLLVSAITAYEYSDLLGRGRLPTTVYIDILRAVLGLILVDFPAALWPVAITLPNIHRDPVYRMLIAHAIAIDATLVTADRTMQRYPVKILW